MLLIANRNWIYIEKIKLFLFLMIEKKLTYNELFGQKLYPIELIEFQRG